MFADAEVTPPFVLRTRAPRHVAAAVVKAVERDKLEVEVATRWVRLMTLVGSLAPSMSARVQRRFGGERFAARLAEAERSKR